MIDLNDLEHFAHSPTGLGLVLSNTYADDNIYKIFTKSEMSQAELAFKVIFGEDRVSTYSFYYQFSQFLNHQPMVLSYTTDGTDEYLRDCRFKSLTKSEIGEQETIHEELVIDFTSPWYQLESGNLFQYTDLENDGKVYDYQYDYIYEDKISVNQRFFLINNNSSYFGIAGKSPIEIVIEAVSGAVTDPSWSILVDNKVVQNDAYNLTIQKGWKLIVSSNPQSRRATLVSPDGTESNAYQNQDMTKTNFVTAPIGESILLFNNIGQANLSYKLRKEVILI